MQQQPKVLLGYACINTSLRKQNVYTGRTITLGRLKEKGIEEAKTRAMNNLEDLETIIKWNEENGIKFYRMSSELFPHMENPKIHETYTIDFARKKLKEIGDLAKKYNQRLTFHPGQFNQLGTPNINVYEQTLKDLGMHADILDTMGLDENSIMIIHGGGYFGDRQATLKRIEENIPKLPQKIRRRICYENDEFYYGVPDLLPLCEKFDIPFCFDSFHHSIKQDIEIDDKIMERIIKTWTKRGLKPKFHISDQKKDAKKGAHGDMVENIPQILLDIPRKYNIDCYIMVEAKLKEKATMQLLEKYFSKQKNKNDEVQWNLKTDYQQVKNKKTKK